MKNGIPCLGHKSGGLLETIGEEDQLLISNFDLNEWADKIKWISIMDLKERKHLSKKLKDKFNK